MSERESYREQEHRERLSVFAGSFRTDPYDYSNIVTHLRPLLGYRQRDDTTALWNHDQDTYVSLYTHSAESVQKMHRLGELFAARPVSHTLYHLTTGRWGELLHTVTDSEAARGAYELPDEYPPPIVAVLASRGLRTAMERARQRLAAHGEPVGSYGEAVLAIMQSRQTVPINPLTPEDLGGLAMPAMRDILRLHPDLQPERFRRK